MITGKSLSASRSMPMTISLEQINHNLNIAKQCLRYISEEMLHQSRDLNAAYINSLHEKDKLLEQEREYYDTSSDLLKKVLDLINDLELSTRIVANKLPIQKKDIASCETDYCENTFKCALVDLMVVSIHCWERSTGKDKIALAEESKLWRVTVDNGQLRVRTMNRYLSVKMLPEIPRWKTALATANYVFKHANQTLEISRELKSMIDYTLVIVRKRALLNA